MDNEAIVDLVGEMLGIDTGIISEIRFKAALWALESLPHPLSVHDIVFDVGEALGRDMGSVVDYTYAEAIEAVRKAL